MIRRWCRADSTFNFYKSSALLFYPIGADAIRLLKVARGDKRTSGIEGEKDRERKLFEETAREDYRDTKIMYALALVGKKGEKTKKRR